MAQATVPVSQIEQIAQRVFAEQAEKLRRELWQEMAAQMPRRSEAEGRVWEAIHELAQAQARTEKRVEELAQAQARTEKRVEELAQAQARTEERLTRLEAAVEELARAQARTEKRVEELAQAQARTEKRVEELAQAQARAEERLTRLEAAVEKLAQAQARTEERLTRLEAAVEELARAQARTEKRVEELAQAQARTEKRVEELAQAQARTEERLTRLEAAVEELARAQARTEKALGELFRHVGYLSNILGADLEVDAEEVLRYALRQKGYRLLGPARPLEIDGEIDVALPVESPAGEQLWAVVEAKARVREKEVERWSRRFKSARFLRRLNQAGVTGPYLPYIFGLRIYPDVLPTAEEAGVGILDFRGEQAEALVVS